MNSKRKNDDDDCKLFAYATLRPFKKNKLIAQQQTNSSTNGGAANQLWRKSFDSLNLIDSFNTTTSSTNITQPYRKLEPINKIKNHPETLNDRNDVNDSNVIDVDDDDDGNKNEKNKNIEEINYEPERIDDYLSELDSYLNAIDSGNEDGGRTICYTNSGISDDDRKNLIDLEGFTEVKLRNHHFSTFPKKKRKNVNCDNSIDETSEGIDEASLFHRSSPSRRTIVTVPKCEGTVVNETRRSRHKKSDATADGARRLSWLRNSMRKTRPIPLPDQTNINCTETSAPSSSLSITRTSPPSTSTTTAIPSERLNLSANNANTSILQNARLGTTTSQEGNNHDPNFPLEIFETNSLQQDLNDRPRQLGRRAEICPRVVSIAADTISSNGNQSITINHERPNSAPARVHVIITQQQSGNQIGRPSQTTRASHYHVESELSSNGSSRNPSPVSLVSSTGSSSIASAVDTTDRPRQRLSSISDTEDLDIELDEVNEKTKWPHQYGRALATVCCTLGLFNLSRFAIFSVHYGANFVVQFFILSLIFGIPMLWLQMALGAKIKSGSISMWRISPICKGIGISLFVAQTILALYSAISLAWVMIYFRDSFTSTNSIYRWREVVEFYRGFINGSIPLGERLSDYFNGVVLQRFQLGPGGRAGASGMGPVRFQLAFNLTVLWVFVFVILCRGLRSYGKILFVIATAPTLILTIVTIRLLAFVELTTFQNMYPATDWPEFFSNSQSWFTAAQETFLTWNLLGVSVLALCSKANKTMIKHKKMLRRDAIFIIVMTMFGLVVASVLGNVCIQILLSKGYFYFTGSYESLSSDVFLYRRHQSLPQNIISLPTKYLPRYATMVGESFRQPGINPFKESGYKPLRLITELLPATFSVIQNELSWTWCTFTMLALLIFGVAQLCAMWKPVANIMGNTPSAVMLSCVVGLLLGIPLATESGINIVHYMDTIIGGSWWLLLLWVGQIMGMFLIRGRPYTADILVNDIHLSQTMSAFFAFAWNLLVPIILMMLCVLEYKSSGSKELFHRRGPSYWSMWARQIGGFIQVSFLIAVPVTAVIQIYRFLSKGPPDILDRIQLLYRPMMNVTTGRVVQRTPTATVSTVGNLTRSSDEPIRMYEDAPPKYSPPPSYTTATGARIAKMLRQSIRRSVRRIMGEPSRNRLAIAQPSSSDSGNQTLAPPPDYSSVVFSSNPSGDVVDGTNIEIGPRNLYNSQTIRDTNSPSTMTTTSTSVNERIRSALTATDVAQLLRPSRRKSQRAASLGGNIDHHTNELNLNNNHSISLEQLNSGEDDKKSTKLSEKKSNDRI